MRLEEGLTSVVRARLMVWRMGVGDKGRTLLDWRGYLRLREETAVQTEIRLDLVTGRTSSGEQISWIEGNRTPEPVAGCCYCCNFHDPGPTEHRRACRIIIGNHPEDDLRISDEHWR